MLTVARGVVINRPIEQVFTFVANFENEPQYNPSLLSMRKTSPGAIGLGTTWQEKVRLAGTHNRTVTVYEPHHILAYQNDGRPFPVEITFHFASVPGGTQLTASPKIQPGGIFKLGAPLFHLLLPKLVERIVSHIKKVLEAQPLTS
jgi:polyketide cyclase/dehydrase/lipid transport protein